MSLNKKLDKLFEADFKKIEEEDLDEANTTADAGGEYDTKYIKEVNSRLFKIERIINQNIKLKTETGIDETKYWKSTRENLQKISEKMHRLSKKLRSF